MSDNKKIILWALVFLLLAIYARSAGLTPSSIGKNAPQNVLGQQTNVPTPEKE